MADLMTDTYDYNSLANKYGNFHFPSVKIFINGTDVLSSMHLVLSEISIVLSLTTASSAQFKLGGVYDKKKRSFISGVTDKFKPGTIVEIAVGYYAATVKILKGFVYMLGCEFGENDRLVVTVMDVRKLMMIGGSRHVFHNVKNYSDIFKNIMSAYAQLCSTKVTATDDRLEEPVSQTCNDYEFIMEELVKKGKTDREFLVVGGTAYFREKPSGGAPLLKMEYGRELLAMEMDYSYLDEEIQVIGYNSHEQTTYTGKVKAKSKEAQVSLVSPSPVMIISDPDADNQDKAARRAAAMAQCRMDAAKSGQLLTVGLPEIVPGRFIEVVQLEPMVNRKYYISEVRHRIDGGFYTTEVEIGGWC